MHKLHLPFYIGLVLILALVSSCVPEPKGSSITGNQGALTIKFTTFYDSIPVEMGDSEQLFEHNGDSIFFKEFRFFVSNVGLENLTTNDLTQLVDDDEVRQFYMPDEPAGGDFEDFLTQTGEYKGIQIDFGVPAELNSSEFDASPFGSKSPLSDPENFSTELKSYKFLELKGVIKKANDEIPFNYRIGKDEFYIYNKKFGKSFILTKDTNNDILNFKIDLKKTLEDIKPSELLNLKVVHDSLGGKMLNDFANGLELVK